MFLFSTGYYSYDYALVYPFSYEITPLVYIQKYRNNHPFHTQQVDWSSRYPLEVYIKGSGQQKRVALTFDDGPDRIWTPQIAQILTNYGVEGTFFVTGNMVNQNPDVLRNLYQQGHEIGNHTWDHPQLPKLSNTQVNQQISRTETAILNVIGRKTRLFRPPYGALSEAVIQQLRNNQYKIILWNVDSVDWSGIPAQTMINNVLAHTGPGSIILFHSGFGRGGLSNTVQALTQIITKLREQGFSFSTVSQLLDIPAYV